MPTSFRSAFAAFLLAAAAAAQTPYGFGAPGTSGAVPTLSCPQPWLGNAAFGATVAAGYGGAAGYLFLSAVPAATSFGALPLWVDLAFALPPFPFVLDGAAGVGGSGSAVVALPLPPPATGLTGFSIFGQAAIVDPAGPFGLTVTNGLQFTFTEPPQVFVGASIAGGTDVAHFVDPVTLGAAFPSAGSSFTDNVNGAAYDDFGRRLYVSTGFGKVNVADLTGPAPVWTTLQNFGATNGVSTDNLRLDRGRRLAWSMHSISGVVELVAVDVDLASPTYGQVTASTLGLSNAVGLIGSWALSPDGGVAAVPSLLGGLLFLIDVAPGSPTFGGLLAAAPIPSTGASALWANQGVAFSADGAEVYVLRQGTGATPTEIARYSLGLGAFVDHLPATPIIDNLGPTVGVATGPAGASLAPLPGGRGLVVCGGFGAAGWAARIDLDPANPTFVGFAAASGATTPGTSVNAPRLALDPDGARLAVGTWSPITVKFFDVATMAYTGQAILTTGGVSQLAWR
jgi:hypothetical protein